MISAALLILSMTPLAMTPGVDDTIFQSGFDDAEMCPQGRQVLADIDYSYGSGECTRYDVDVTEWNNIWGYSCSGDSTPFPGNLELSTILNFGKTTYIAAHFHVPADLSPDAYGWITHDEVNYGGNLTASISPSCGDFSTVAQTCFTAAISGQGLVPWAVSSPPSFCRVVPGQDYFLNVRMTDAIACEPSATTCAVGMGNDGNDAHEP